MKRILEALKLSKSPIVRPGTPAPFTQATAQTGEKSRFIVRRAQTRERMVLPPDLLAHAPTHGVSPHEGELLTLLDLDHLHADCASACTKTWIHENRSQTLHSER